MGDIVNTTGKTDADIVRQIEALLEAHGCDCLCNCFAFAEEHNAYCDPCLACLIKEVILKSKKASKAN
jgi:hypothetical protein